MKYVKIIALMLALISTLALVSCDDEDETKNGNPSDGGKEEVTLPPTKGLEYALNEGGESYSVTGCSTYTVKTLVIPSTYDGKPVTAIAQRAFSYHSSCQKVVIPDSITSIASGAFENCKAVQVEGNVSYIDKWVIDCDENVTSITLRENTVGLAERCFASCQDFSSITLPQGLQYIDGNAFYDCYKLESIVIPDSVKYIDEAAFDNCSALRKVVLPKGITSIKRGTFEDCRALESIVIPKSVSVIESSAFGSRLGWDNGSCYQVVIYYGGSENDWNAVENNNEDVLKERPIYFYSEKAPTGSGNYWHYVNGEATPW